MAKLSFIWQSGAQAAGGAIRQAERTHKGANAHSSSHLLRWLMSLGGLGIFGLAIVDSSVIPIPLPGSTDLLLLLLASHRGSTPASAAWLTMCAFSGSMIGGYFAWATGRKGGETALKRYVPERFIKRITTWMNTHGAWSVGVVTLLPPPVPLMPFVVAAGALGVSRGRFLTFYAIARVIRYGFLAWFGVTYGRHMVRVWLKTLGGWAPVLVWIYVGLIAAGVIYGVWKFLQARKTDHGSRRPVGDAA